MIERDRELLRRLMLFNTHLGEVVVELMQRQDNGELPARDLHQLADRFDGAAAELRERAVELAALEDEPPPDVVIDRGLIRPEVR